VDCPATTAERNASFAIWQVLQLVKVLVVVILMILAKVVLLTVMEDNMGLLIGEQL
jgi:hypothetical protein